MDYSIIDGVEGIESRDVARLLKMTYWANRRSPEQIEEAMRHSSCYGVAVDGGKKLVGFARVISDHATAFYLCDVIVDPAYQRQGLGKALLSHILALPEYKGLRGLLLTRDAHGFYEKFGFQSADGRAMTKSPEI